MLRSLIRNFHNLSILQSQLVNSATFCKCNFFKLQRPVNVRAFNQRVTAPVAERVFHENDTEYMLPYHVEKETKQSAKDIVAVLRKKFRLNAKDVNLIMENESVHRAQRMGNLGNTLELLSLEGVTKQSFIHYPWILTMEPVRLKQKIQLLKTMPVRIIDDFVPLLRLSVSRLNKIVRQLNKEANTIPYGNRLYYISEKIGISANIVAQYLAKRLFILEMPFEMLEQNLQLMIDYEVPPVSLLRDLWAFRYAPKAVKNRLERVKSAKKDKIMPWMVRCTEPILQRTLKLSLDELTVLDGKHSTVEYIAERLGYTVDETRAIMDKHPLTHRVRVTKVKEVLDYLLNEAGYEKHEIAQVPRILCHGLKTTKARLEQLKSLGCRPTSLNIICLSRKEYEKFLNEWKNRNNMATSV